MKKKILCIGEVLWDVFPTGKFMGGAPFNVASHLHMLGQPVAVVSRVGKDPLGDQIRLQTKKMGMYAESIQRDEELATGTVHITLDPNGNAGYEIVGPVAWDNIELNNRLLRMAGQVSAVVFGSLAQRNPITRETIRRLRKVSRLNIFDINLRPPFDDKDIVERSLIESQMVKLNDQELEQVSQWFGLPGDANNAVRELGERFSCSTVCLTRGERGALLWHNKSMTEHPGYKVRVSDTVGAGDAFLAALIDGILKNNENHQILQFANAVGAYVATQNGPTPRLDFAQIDGIISGINPR